jgi:predicted acetyltransferase
MEIRRATADELPAFLRTIESAFHEDVRADHLEMERTLFEPERSLVVVDDGALIGGGGIYTRELTIPGAVLEVAGVTMIGVLPTQRRRGVLTGIMRRQFDDIRAAGEPVAELWASEANIYGRFGYGLAARHATVTLRTGGARLRPGAPEPSGRMTLLEPADAIPRIAPVYDRVRRERPGHLDRNGPWWPRRMFDPEWRRDGFGALRVAVHEDAGGAVDGWVIYAVRPGWGEDGPNGAVRARELTGATPAATAALWDYVLGLDLTRTVTIDLAAPDEPLATLIEGPQRPRAELSQNLWVRLVDVGAALAARAYGAPLDVVFEVEDAFCAWNAGRWHLETDGAGAACVRTEAPADVALTAAELGAAYLGGTSLAALAAVGRVHELRAGAVEAAALAFRGAREPWCPEIF